MLEEGKGKQTFSDEEKVREFVISRPTLKEFLNNFLFFLLFYYSYMHTRLGSFPLLLPPPQNFLK
jgi:hypothetical protein